MNVGTKGEKKEIGKENGDGKKRKGNEEDEVKGIRKEGSKREMMWR